MMNGGVPRLDVCPLCKGKDFSELFAGDVIKFMATLPKRELKIAMWGDYLLESVRDKGPRTELLQQV